MEYIVNAFIAVGAAIFWFALFPVWYGRNGGYKELVKKFRDERPLTSSTSCQNIVVERGSGYFNNFNGVKFHFDETGIYISPIFRLWEWGMPTILIPYSDFKVNRGNRYLIFTKTEIIFNDLSLPKITLSGKFYNQLNDKTKIT